jgi:hypothetical protein
MRKRLKPIFNRFGMEAIAKEAYVKSQLLGEYIKFSITGNPEPEQSILLSGSARSGTTWLANILSCIPRTQQIFEPMIPLWNDEIRRLTGWDRSDPYIRGVYLRPEGEYREWEAYIYKLMTGQIRNYWTDYDRSSYFPDRFLVKEVRANMMLGFIHDKFKSKIIHIIRHPCAVVYSRLAAPTPWHADVRDLLCQEELVEDYLRPWIREIEKEKDLIGAHAVLWSVENLVARKELASRAHYWLDYETLCLEPWQTSLDIMAWLGVREVTSGLEAKLKNAIRSPSRMSHSNIEHTDTMSRLTKWKHRLPPDAQSRILNWADRLGVPYYDQANLSVDIGDKVADEKQN